jgi:alginate O-acetyltransferase complex protein AlgI
MAGFTSGVRAPYDIGYFLDALVVLALSAGIIGSAPRVARSGRALLEMRASARGPRLAADAAVLATVAVLFATAVLFLAASTYSPFIYFQF